MTKKTAVPTIGPSIVPMPPITTMKIMYAVQLTVKAASGWVRHRVKVEAPAGAPAPEPRHDVDEELRPHDVHAEALGAFLVVADRRQGEAEARAKDEVDEQDGAGARRQRGA